MGKASKKKLEYIAQYDKEQTKGIHLKLHKGYDFDILEKLESVSNEEGGKQGYIKRLIREDIVRHKKSSEIP